MENLVYKYRTISLDSSLEFNEKLDLLNGVWKEALKILKGLNITNKRIKRWIKNKNYIRIREGTKRFLELAFEMDIPVIIMSDGISEVIKSVLYYYNCYYDNIYIYANDLSYDNNTEMNKIVNSFNKNELFLYEYIKEKISNRNNCILFTSNINDFNMISESKLNNSIKVAFLDKNINENFDMFINYFNVICTHETSLQLLFDKFKEIFQD